MKAVLRFERDKRGYEYFSLVQPASQRHGRAPTRLLYWFRTPPGVRVGRSPFDADMQRAIEAQYPGVVFDWPRLLAAPVQPPSASPERWRERRAAERAARAARSALRQDLGIDRSGSDATTREEDANQSKGDGAAHPEAVDQGRINEQGPMQGQISQHAAADPEIRMMPGRRRRRRRRRRNPPDAGEV